MRKDPAMSELVRFGRSTIDVSKIAAFREEDDQVVSIVFDAAAFYSLAGGEAGRFLRYLAPRVIVAAPDEPIVAGEAEGSPVVAAEPAVRRHAP